MTRALRVALCIVLLWAGTASAKDLTLHWTNPTQNAVNATDSCLVEGAAPISTYLGTDVYVASFGDRDTLYARIPGTKGAPDSVVAALADSVTMGVAWVRSVNGLGPSCGYASLVWVKPNVPPPPGPEPGAGLLGEYWRGSKNNSFSALLATRVDSTVAFDWGFGSPMQGVPADSFCVRWDGFINVPSDGLWTFYVRSSEGCRLWIDGTPVIDQWIYSFAQTFDGAVSLTRGWRAIRLEYFEDVNDASCVLSWSGPGQTKAMVPASALSH